MKNAETLQGSGTGRAATSATLVAHVCAGVAAVLLPLPCAVAVEASNVAVSGAPSAPYTPAPDAVPSLHAQAPSSAASQAVQRDIQLVQDLLDLDAQAALAAERRRAGLPDAHAFAPASAGGTQHAPSAPMIEVAAIYGVAGRLHADVLIDGRMQTYRAGQPLPLGVPAGFGLPQLQRIAGACVVLESDRQAQRSCMLKGRVQP